MMYLLMLKYPLVLQSKNVDLSQRCKEFEALIAKPGLMVDVLPVDASCEDIEVGNTVPLFSQHFEILRDPCMGINGKPSRFLIYTY